MIRVARLLFECLLFLPLCAVAFAATAKHLWQKWRRSVRGNPPNIPHNAP